MCYYLKAKENSLDRIIHTRHIFKEVNRIKETKFQNLLFHRLKKFDYLEMTVWTLKLNNLIYFFRKLPLLQFQWDPNAVHILSTTLEDLWCTHPECGLWGLRTAKPRLLRRRHRRPQLLQIQTIIWMLNKQALHGRHQHQPQDPLQRRLLCHLEWCRYKLCC